MPNILSNRQLHRRPLNWSFFISSDWIIYILTKISCVLKSNSIWKYYRKLKRPQLVLGAFSCGPNAGSQRVTHNIPSALGKEVACTSDSCGNLFTIVFAMFPSLCGLARCSHSECAHVSLWLPRGGFSASDNTREQVRADCPQWPLQWKTLSRAPRVEARQGEVRDCSAFEPVRHESEPSF